jgi:hypothetical protein
MIFKDYKSKKRMKKELVAATCIKVRRILLSNPTEKLLC